MTDAEKEVRGFLDGLATRAVDLIDRECAVEEGRDHHAVLILLAAGNVLLGGLPDQRAYKATADTLPILCEMVYAEMLRRQQEREKKMH